MLAAAVMLCTAAPGGGYSSAAAAKDISDTMSWDAMRIGGGGFVSGIVTGKKVMYARTDVGGAYRYNFTADRWEQLFGTINEQDKGMLSVDSMCVDPTDDNTVYFLCGCAYFSDARTAIYKTTDGGKTFEIIDVTDLIQVHGNGYGRQCGESIAVDPDNPNILYCGGDVASGSSALIMSKDAGKTWTPVAGYDKLGYYKHTVKWPHWTEHTVRACTTDQEQAYNEQNGVSTIAISNGKVYVGTSITGQTNVVVGKVGGDSFTALSADLPTNVYPSRINKDANGNLLLTYVAGLTFAKGAGGAYRIDPKTDAVTDISPVHDSLGAVISDPKDANKLYATTCGVWSSQKWGEGKDAFTCWGEWMYRSTDGGANWQEVYAGKSDGKWVYDEELGDMTDHQLFASMQTGGYDWIWGKAIHWSGSMMLDPTNPDRIYVVSGNGVFRWDNIWGEGYDDSPVATFHPDGIEEVVSLDFCSTADGLDLSAIGDYDGFVHQAINKIGLQYKPNMGSTSAIAVCPQDTDVWVRTAEGDANNSGSAYYTKDRGKTWNVMKPATTGGKVAIAKIDSKTYRIFNTRTGGVSYSDDFGETWNNIALTGIFYNMKPGVLPDPEDPSTVWIYGYSKAANEYDTTPTEYKLYKSTDGGKTFSDPISVCTYDQCDPATRIAYLGGGNIVLGGGWHGLYYVEGKTAKVTKLPVYYCKTVGYGAPEKTGGINTLFMYGRPEETDTEGIYRSTDGGQTWVCINTEHLYGGTGNGNYIVGDMNEFGKMYMSTVGCGIICGWISGTEPQTSSTTASSTSGSSTSGTTTGSTVKWGDTDCNGTVELKDAVLLAKALSGAADLSVEGRRNAAVCGNDALSGADLTKILKHLAGILTATELAP